MIIKHRIIRRRRQMNQHTRQFQKSLTTAFIDSTIPSNLAYKPQFISNNYKEGRKVLSIQARYFFPLLFHP